MKNSRAAALLAVILACVSFSQIVIAQDANIDSD
jgi:hypothetical protein